MLVCVFVFMRVGVSVAVFCVCGVCVGGGDVVCVCGGALVVVLVHGVGGVCWGVGVVFVCVLSVFVLA